MSASSISMLAPREVAAMLGIRIKSVLTLIHTGQLPGVDVSLVPGGRPRWRVAREELDAFLRRRTHSAAPKRRRRRRREAIPVKEYF
jgi:excisionase family DNA binding protein